MVEAAESTAAPDVPWLSVSALGEATYCPRAGLLCAETEFDVDDHPPPTNLDFTIPYSTAELERSLHQSLNRVWLLAGLAAATLTLAAFSWWNQFNLGLLAAALGLVALAGPIARRVEYVRLLTQLRSVLLADDPQTPDLQAADRQNFDWFAMLADEWMSVRDHEPLRDEGLALVGSPWRTLRRGGVAIPVIKIRRSDGQEPRIYPSHMVRLAAYCHLLETCQGCDSPCGVVLFGDTLRGVTLPYDAAARRLFLATLKSAREALIASAAAARDPAPPPRERCLACPWGAPIAHRGAATEITRCGEPLPVYGIAAPNGRLYHSRCGDRFVWTPPHERAQRLQMRV